MVVAALGAASPAGAADRKLDRVLIAYVDAQATNDYYFFLNAFRGQPGGATVAAAFSNERSTALYIRRNPALVTKHRIKADLGELGEVDIRVRKATKWRRDSNRCGRQASSAARFRGGLRLQSDFTDVRTARLTGFLVRASVRRKCANEYGPPFYFNHGVNPVPVEPKDPRLLTTCGGEAGAGFVAIKQPEDEGELFFEQAATEFVATKTTRSDGLEIIRSTGASGTTRRFGIQGKRARVSPPEPFTGRAHFENGRLSGNLRVALPGAGEVRLTPGQGDLGKASTVAIPKCFPTYFAGAAGRPAVDQAVAAAVQHATLSRAARRAFAALGSR